VSVLITGSIGTASPTMFSSKLAANYAVALSLNALIRSIYGKSRKVLVLDLDNTLWGGVIGDDGVDKIQIGRETLSRKHIQPFRSIALPLRNRGWLVCAAMRSRGL
jgi:predicted enzyme involved in methoxymalonyl-ACP biosynthesis